MKRPCIHIATAAIAAFIAAIAVAVCIRMYAHYPAGDELRYFYCFDNTQGRDYFALATIQPVEDWGDIVHSMGCHYVGVNGRVLVHSFEMAISALAGPEWFYPLNTIVLILAVIGCGRLCGRRLRRNVLWWAIVITLWLHAFPEPGRLWLSINLAPNYLWPSLGSMALIWAIYGRRSAWLQCTLAFLVGASNEGFSLPLCGALWCVALWGCNDRRPPLSTMIALSVGCLVLVWAPGNWQRMAANDASGSGLLTGLEMLGRLPALWFFVAMAAAVAVRNGIRGLWRDLTSMPVISLALAMSLLMSVAVHTGQRSLTPVALFAVMAGLRLLEPMIHTRNTRGSLWAAVALLTIVTAHQIIVTIEHVHRYEQIGNVIDTARNARRGKAPAPTEFIKIHYNWAKPPRPLQRYVYDQPPTRFGTEYQWRLQGRYYAGIQIYTY